MAKIVKRNPATGKFQAFDTETNMFIEKVETLIAEVAEPKPAKVVTPKAEVVKPEKVKAEKPAKTPKVKTPKVKEPKPAKAPKVKAIKVPASTVTILKALYGIEGVATIDITDKVTIGTQVNNKLAGSDPASGKKKHVYVTANVDGVEVTKSFAERQPISFMTLITPAAPVEEKVEEIVQTEQVTLE